mgnify:CR=1 FL=1
MQDHCPTHSELVGSLKVLISDIKWLIRIGKWALAVMSAAIMMVIPLSVTFFVHVSRITGDIEQVKAKVALTDKSIEKLSIVHDRFEDAVRKDIKQLFDQGEIKKP